MSFLKSAKGLAKDMSIYGISTILSQLISFFLLPLYTSYLSPQDYGILSLVGVFSGGYSILSNFGVGSAVFRFAGMADSEDVKKVYLDNAQFANIAINLFFLVLSVGFSSFLAYWLFQSNDYRLFLIFGIFNGLLTSLAAVPLSFLRIQRRTPKIAVSSLINLFVSVGCTFTALIVLELGVLGALIGSALGSFASLLYLVFNINIPRWVNLSMVRMKELLRYALPMLPHKFFGFSLPMLSQVLLARFLTLGDLGLYSVAYKFCLPLVLFTNLFQKSFSPYRFEILKAENESRNLFRNFNLLYLLLVSLGYTAINLFGSTVIELITNIRYHQAGQYIPFIALIPVAQGMYFIFGTGIEFSKSPKYLPVISGLGVAAVIVFSLLLIPRIGIHGAGLATSIGWLLMALAVLGYAQSHYQISYAWPGIFFIFILTAATVCCFLFVTDQSLFSSLLLFVSYVGLLMIFFNSMMRKVYSLLISRNLKFVEKQV